MRKLNIILFCSLLAILAACSKDNDKVVLPGGSVSFQYPTGKDTIEMPLSIQKDSLFVLSMKAALAGNTSTTEHWVSFAIDSTKLNDYRAKYGNATLMPSSSYLFYKSTTPISAGTSVSEEVELNIGQQTKLTEYTTYVLPVVIKSVDGSTEGTATSRVLYYVFKTGKPLFISKTGWAITSFSSQFNAFAPTNLIDNLATTYWATNINQVMPQWVIINFNRDVTFSAINYSVPAILKYPTLGGYPTSMQIETSMNGTTWVNKGIFPGNIVNNLQTIDLGLTTARHLRFTSLAAVKYSNTYDAVFISDISLVP